VSEPAALGVIVRAELTALRNRLLKRNPVRLALLVIALVVAAVVIGGTTFTIGATVGRFLAYSVDPLLAAGFTGLSLLMLVVGFPTVIASFFVGRDLLQLVVAPVRTRDIFIARLVSAMSANLLISGILVAAVLGVGVGAGAPLAYFPLAVVLIAVEILTITSLQAILMSLILRWVPARMARDVAAAVAGLTGAGLYLAWNLSLRQTFGRTGRPDLSGLTGFAQHIDWLPTTWPGHALSALLAGSSGVAIGWLAASLVLAAILLVMAAFLYEQTLLSGLGIFGGTSVVWRRRSQRQAAPRLARGAGSPAFAIARKDWLGFRRDVRRLTRLLPALLLPIGYAVVLSQPGRTLSGFWSNVALLTFLSMFMASALATPSIPSERRGFQLLRMAPLTMWQLLRAKVLIALPAVLATMLVFSVAVAVASKSGPLQLLELLAFGIWLAFGFVSIAVSGGAIDPRFEATDDRRSVGLVGSLASIGGSLAFALLSIGALALFVLGGQAAEGTAALGPIPQGPAIGTVIALAGVILLAGGCGLVALLLWIANSRLRSFEASIAAT
jgi:ABC-2 type transport system permease protein